MKSKILKILIILLTIIFLTIILFRVLVPIVAKNYIEKKISEFETAKNVSVKIENINVLHCSVWGKFAFEVQNMSFKSNKAEDELLTIKHLVVEMQLLKGFSFSKDIKSLNVEGADLHIVKNGGYNNYSFLDSNSVNPVNSDYCTEACSLIDAFNSYCPDYLELKESNFIFDIDTVNGSIMLKQMSIKEKEISGNLLILLDSLNAVEWNLNGKIDKKNKDYFGKLSMADSTMLCGFSFGYKNQFDSVRFENLTFNMKVETEEKEHVALRLSSNIKDFTFFNKYVASHSVLVENVGAKLDINIFPHELRVDSTSELKLNKVLINPFIRYEKNKNRHILFKIDEKQCDVQKLFASLPQGLFVVVPHLKAKGNINYSLLFDCNFEQIDSLKFDFDICSSDRSFELVEGTALITQFNEDFEYPFYDNNVLVRMVPIQSSNPYFCDFLHIPAYLKNAILVSEDPSFFNHRGFVKSAIRDALIADLHAGKLKRGGSTISMQLVKNLFLNRKKVFSRKVEELLLVWLIENYRLISKERMFEIYVNIVEWAPNIIGIGEASEFYFGKNPSELNLGECVYLATIIRSPKHFAYTLDSTGVANIAKQEEIKLIVQKMLERELITPEEASNAIYEVRVQNR